FWELNIPSLRPRPYSRPHPFAIRAASGEHSLVELGAAGKPFLLNVQSLETTRHRIDRWREAARAHGIGDEAMSAALAQSWVWRNVHVAESDAHARRLRPPAFQAM